MGYLYLEAVKEEVSKCVKCGLCLSVCPLYEEVPRELFFARGRNIVCEEILSGKAFQWHTLSERLSWCLGCNRCGRSCPAGLKAAEVTFALRAEAVKQKGLSLWKALLPHLITRRGSFGLLIYLFSLFGRLWTKERSFLRHMPGFLKGLPRGLRIPRVFFPPLRYKVPERLPPKGRRVLKVAFFFGCSTEYVFQKAALNFLRFLLNRGVEVIMPKGQVCCGMPFYGWGDRKGWELMVFKNLKAFCSVDFDYLLTLCPSCGLALKGLYPDPLASKTLDFTELVLDLLDTRGLRSGLGGKRVTYHHPCHLAAQKGIKEQPKKVIRAIEGLELFESPDGCCGMGGSFAIQHPELSQRMASKRLRELLKTGADVVLTTCPGCVLQLSHAAKKGGPPIEVLHLAEVFLWT